MKDRKLTKISMTAAACAGLISSAHSATIIGAAPTVDVLVNDIATTNLVNSNMIDEASAANHGRADSFTLATTVGGSYEITSVTLAKNGNQTFNGDTMTVFIAAGGATEWDLGTGHDTATDGVDYLVDTGMTLQGQEVFTLTGAVTGAQFVTFEFAAPIVVADNAEYTVGFVFDQGSGPDRFGYDEINNGGGRLSVTTAAYGGASSRGISFSVQGTAIPEPSAAILGAFGLLGLLRRRRR